MKFLKLIACLIFVMMAMSCSSGRKDDSITVFAAASTTDLMTEIALLFEKDTGIEVCLNTASSGTLARQLENGAEADLFISASRKWIDYAEEKKLLEESRAFLKNRLVLITHKDSFLNSFTIKRDSDISSLLTNHLSMGDPEHVPAGKYAKDALVYLGSYDSLEDYILPAPDVRAALSVVEFDEAELGIVYETDALRSDDVKILSFFPGDSHPPVLYYCALTDRSSSRGRMFYQYLSSSLEVEELCSKYGFSGTED